MRGNTRASSIDASGDAAEGGPAPGKRSRSEALPAHAAPSGAPGAAAAGAPPDLSYTGLFGFDLAAGFGNQGRTTTAAGDASAEEKPAAEPKAKTKASQLTAEDFDVSVPWRVGQLDDVESDTLGLAIFGGKIHTVGTAKFKPHVTVDKKQFDLGFTQTLISCERIAIYATQPDIDSARDARAERLDARTESEEAANGFEALGATEHQRRTLSFGPAFDRQKSPTADPPFFESIAELGTQAEIIDEPAVAAPITSQDGKGTLTALAGADHFLTHLIVKPWEGKPIFLAWATWRTDWDGDVSVADKRFDAAGRKVRLNDEGSGKHGAPLLGGTPANERVLDGVWSKASKAKAAKPGKKQK